MISFIVLLTAITVQCLLPFVEAASVSGNIETDAVIFTLHDPKAARSYLKYITPENDFKQKGKVSNFTTLIASEKDEEYWGLTASHNNKKIFWNEFKQENLYVYDTKRRQIHQIVQHMTIGLEDLAFDDVTNVLYWTDARVNGIFAVDKTYKFITRIQDTGNLQPHALTIHVSKRKLIYSKFLLTFETIHKGQLVKCDLDGKNPETIVAFPDIVQVVGVTIDYKDDRIFWTDRGLGGNSVLQSSDFDGKSRKEHFSSFRGLFADIARYKGLFFLTDLTKTRKSLYNIHIRYRRTRQSKPLKSKLIPRNVESYAPHEWSSVQIENECNESRCNHVCVAAHRGKHVCKCSEGFRLTNGENCVSDYAQGDHFIVLDIAYGRLFQLLDSKKQGTKSDLQAYPIDGNDDLEITAFAVDSKEGDVIYYNAKRKAFTVWNGGSLSFNKKVRHIQVDSCNKILYWNTKKNIYRWKQGSESILIIYSARNSTINRIALDLKNNAIYWTEQHEAATRGSIHASDLNGDTVRVVLEKPRPLFALSISYETKILNVASPSGAILIVMKLKKIQKVLHTNKKLVDYDYHEADLTENVKHIGFIQDFVMVKDMMYIVDRRRPSLLRFNWTDGPQTVESYGPNRFLYPTMIVFRNPTRLLLNRGEFDCPERATSTPKLTTNSPMTTSSTIVSTPENVFTATKSTPATPKTASKELSIANGDNHPCNDILRFADENNEGALKAFEVCMNIASQVGGSLNNPLLMNLIGSMNPSSTTVSTKSTTSSTQENVFTATKSTTATPKTASTELTLVPINPTPFASTTTAVSSKVTTISSGPGIANGDNHPCNDILRFADENDEGALKAFQVCMTIGSQVGGSLNNPLLTNLLGSTTTSPMTTSSTTVFNQATTSSTQKNIFTTTKSTTATPKPASTTVSSKVTTTSSSSGIANGDNHPCNAILRFADENDESALQAFEVCKTIASQVGGSLNNPLLMDLLG